LISGGCILIRALVPAPAIKQGGHAQPPDTGWSIETEADRQLVLEQLDRMLSSPVFRGSKRLSGFLRYIVIDTLDNGGAELKERLIGVHVFGRPADYDTSAEPVVRVSAGDLRKRIAQYYHEPACEHELRIDLPVGSYHPVFHLPSTVSAASALPVAEEPRLAPVPVILPASPAGVAPVEVTLVRSVRWKSPRVLFVAAAIVAVVAAAAVAVSARIAGNAWQQFWEPVVAEKGSAMIYAGARHDDGDRLVFEDAVAIVDLGGDLRANNKPFRVLRQGDVSPDVLKKGPSLLIGGFTNPEARRLTQQLRFTFATEGDGPTATGYIQDRQNLNKRDWSVPKVQQGAVPTFTDYAIISRAVDPVTDKLAVVSAGIRRFGTLGAAEFLSDSAQMEALSVSAPRDWRKKNMQAVLAIDVKDGVASRPRVVASYFW
jgi:hypothetical protein